MTWVLIILSWLVIWRWCAHYYTSRGVALSNRMASSGPQTAPAARSAQPGTQMDPYAPVRSEAIQGLVGLGWNRHDCARPVQDAQADLIWQNQPVTTESLLRAVLAKRAAELRA